MSLISALLFGVKDVIDAAGNILPNRLDMLIKGGSIDDNGKRLKINMGGIQAGPPGLCRPSLFVGHPTLNATEATIGGSYSLGSGFYVTRPRTCYGATIGLVTAAPELVEVRLHRGTNNTPVAVAHFNTVSGPESYHVDFPSPVAVDPNVLYKISYAAAHYPHIYTGDYNLMLPQTPFWIDPGAIMTGNYFYTFTGGYPDNTTSAEVYLIEPTFDDGGQDSL